MEQRLRRYARPRRQGESRPSRAGEKRIARRGVSSMTWWGELEETEEWDGLDIECADVALVRSTGASSGSKRTQKRRYRRVPRSGDQRRRTDHAHDRSRRGGSPVRERVPTTLNA